MEQPIKLSRRAAALAILSLPLGDYRALHASGGVLTVDLNQWREIKVVHGTRTVSVSMQEIFKALTEEK